jgi:hypothetical protein
MKLERSSSSSSGSNSSSRDDAVRCDAMRCGRPSAAPGAGGRDSQPVRQGKPAFPEFLARMLAWFDGRSWRRHVPFSLRGSSPFSAAYIFSFLFIFIFLYVFFSRSLL